MDINQCKCDQCGKIEPVKRGSLSGKVDGWFIVITDGAGAKDFCSKQCAQEYLKGPVQVG